MQSKLNNTLQIFLKYAFVFRSTGMMLHVINHPDLLFQNLPYLQSFSPYPVSRQNHQNSFFNGRTIWRVGQGLDLVYFTDPDDGVTSLSRLLIFSQSLISRLAYFSFWMLSSVLSKLWILPSVLSKMQILSSVLSKLQILSRVLSKLWILSSVLSKLFQQNKKKTKKLKHTACNDILT